MKKKSKREKININSFTTITVLGRGAYAEVLLVKHKITQELYAMKILKKSGLRKKKQIKHIEIERNILVSAAR